MKGLIKTRSRTTLFERGSFEREEIEIDVERKKRDVA